jgi:hypothetical protein
MNATEVTALLAICASFDNRKPNTETVTAWTAALGDLGFIAARDAVVAHYQESREWIMPADIRRRVRADRKSRIEDDVIPMPAGLDPDDTAPYIRVLRAGRAALAEGRDLPQPEGLTRRSLRELGGPVRRVNELDAEERAAYAQALRDQRAEALRVLAEKPAPEPDPPATFACEHRTEDQPCGQPAPHLSADRRRPLCDGHRDDETETTEGSAA